MDYQRKRMAARVARTHQQSFEAARARRRERNADFLLNVPVGRRTLSD
jgi:hypothetical protein